MQIRIQYDKGKFQFFLDTSAIQYIETNVTDDFLAQYQARQKRDRDMFAQGKAEDKLGSKHAS